MIYYFCPDHDVPSWGMGMLYYHVYFLTTNNIEACILHNKPPFKLSWLSLNIPVKYIQNNVKPIGKDIMVVPEYYAADKIVARYKCRKIVFVQNSFILFERITPSALNKLGYEAAFYYMPHLKKVLSRFFAGPLFETPAFIPGYYFKDPSALKTRDRSIIIYPKTDNRDYNIIEKLLEDEFPKPGIVDKLFKKEKATKNWDIIILKNLSHIQVAALMREAAFFVNLNTHEAFNSSVPEAMAAGCINFTYDAFGPTDFLEDNKNAFVFNNNHVYSLFERLQYYTEHYNESKVVNELNSMRKQAYKTANGYTTDMAETAIVNIFKELID
jgi:glycosyltransferase involved in cell wall biosynthesis